MDNKLNCEHFVLLSERLNLFLETCLCISQINILGYNINNLEKINL